MDHPVVPSGNHSYINICNLNGRVRLNSEYTTIKFTLDASARSQESACLLGMRGMRYQFQPLEDLKAETNFELRTWKVTWWMNQRSIMKV